MSMRTDIIYGVGFEVCASDMELKNFFLKHRKTIEEMSKQETISAGHVLDYIDKTDDVSFNPKEDLYDYENLFTGEAGLYGLIADIMFGETKIRFEYRRDQEGEHEYIMFPQVMPWNLNQAEKDMTAESYEEICKKYIAELNPNLQYDEDISLEYFG